VKLAGLLSAAGLLLAACGGSTPNAEAPAGGADETKEAKSDGPGQKCLDEASATLEAPADAPEEIAVSHILVRHADLERPEGASRSRAEACLRALEARLRMESGLDWDAAVSEYSDSPGAMHGALGSVAPSELEPAFAGAAFSLDAGQMSYVVETSRGFHLILRTE